MNTLIDDLESLSISEPSLSCLKSNMQLIIDEKRKEEDERREKQKQARLEAKKNKKDKNNGKNNKKNNKKGKNKNKNVKEEIKQPEVDEEIKNMGLIGLEEFVGRKKDSSNSRDIKVEGVSIAFGSTFL